MTKAILIDQTQQFNLTLKRHFTTQISPVDLGLRLCHHSQHYCNHHFHLLHPFSVFSHLSIFYFFCFLSCPFFPSIQFSSFTHSLPASPPVLSPPSPPFLSSVPEETVICLFLLLVCFPASLSLSSLLAFLYHSTNYLMSAIRCRTSLSLSLYIDLI